MPDVDSYIATLPPDRRNALTQLREAIVTNLPDGFEEILAGTPSYVVPLSLFPDGYHCSSNTPLPFLGFASQKNFVALYHFGMYVDQELLQWFVDEYRRQVSSKLDMGKSCVRFKKMDQIPFDLIGQLAAKRTVNDWVSCYKNALQA